MAEFRGISGEDVLGFIDAESGLSFDQIVQKIGTGTAGNGIMALMSCLVSLHRSKLICVPGLEFNAVPAECQDDAGKFDMARAIFSLQYDPRFKEFKIHTTQHWMEVKRDISTRWIGKSTETAEFSITATPKFGAVSQQIAGTDIFVIMPFSPQCNSVYSDHIRPVAARMRLSVSRADEVFSSNAIFNDIWSMIVRCGVVVADLSGRNPNVFYELGIAHTLGKKTIVVSDNISDIPFDVRHIRTLIYTYTPPGMHAFEQELTKYISQDTRYSQVQ